MHIIIVVEIFYIFLKYVILYIEDDLVRGYHQVKQKKFQ